MLREAHHLLNFYIFLLHLFQTAIRQCFNFSNFRPLFQLKMLNYCWKRHYFYVKLDLRINYLDLLHALLLKQLRSFFHLKSIRSSRFSFSTFFQLHPTHLLLAAVTNADLLLDLCSY